MRNAGIFKKLEQCRMCADVWCEKVLEHFPNIQLSILVGGYAQKWHFLNFLGVTKTVAYRRNHWPDKIPLQHPSWRNLVWLKRNTWLHFDLIPKLRSKVRDV